MFLKFLFWIVGVMSFVGISNPESTHAALIFTDGYESGDFSNWNLDINNRTKIVTSPARGGKYAAKFELWALMH